MSARFRADLLRREKDAVAAVSAAYAVADKEIAERLDALTARIAEAQADGETVNEDWLRAQARYRELLQQVEESLRGFADVATPVLTDAQKGFVVAAAGHTAALIRAALGPSSLSVTFNALPKAVLETLVGFASGGGPLSALLEDLGPAAADGVRDALIAGVAAGENPNAIAGRVQSAMNTSRARAVSIARTETLRAARQASIDTYAANADVVDGWTWLSACDARTCAACWAMNGTTHPFTESLDGHPQCRCVPVPLTKSWTEITGDDSLEDTRPAVTPGADLFASLSEAEQREILGPALHALYKAGVPLSAMVTQTSDERYGTMRRVATVQEAQANVGR